MWTSLTLDETSLTSLGSLRRIVPRTIVRHTHFVVVILYPNTWVCITDNTPQKTNMEPENHPKMKRKLIFQTFIFGVPCQTNHPQPELLGSCRSEWCRHDLPRICRISTKKSGEEHVEDFNFWTQSYIYLVSVYAVNISDFSAIFSIVYTRWYSTKTGYAKYFK